MIPVSTIALILFAAAAVFNVLANVVREKFLVVVYVTKPLLMPLLILHYVTGSGEVHWLIVAALAFGFFGDLFIMLPGEKEGYFMAGLCSFLLNLLVYVVLFLKSIGNFQPPPVWFYPAALPYILYGVIVYRLLGPGLGKLKIPVIVYMTVILLLGISALLRTVRFEGESFWLVFAGSISFMASDSILAIDRFRRRLPLAQPILMATYIAAQFLIARGFMLQ